MTSVLRKQEERDSRGEKGIVFVYSFVYSAERWISKRIFRAINPVAAIIRMRRLADCYSEGAVAVRDAQTSARSIDANTSLKA